MEIKITRRRKLYENHNSMVSNYCYLVQGRIYDESGAWYKKFRFVVIFDGYDLYEAEMTAAEYLEESIAGFTMNIESFENCKAFYEMCKDSIEHYNEAFARVA